MNKREQSFFKYSFSFPFNCYFFYFILFSKVEKECTCEATIIGRPHGLSPQ